VVGSRAWELVVGIVGSKLVVGSRCSAQCTWVHPKREATTLGVVVVIGERVRRPMLRPMLPY
jgi:hypothetical protein